jgi:hypothetical protein
MENETFMIFGHDAYKMMKRISFLLGTLAAAVLINKILKANDSKVTVGYDFYEIVKNKALSN